MHAFSSCVYKKKTQIIKMLFLNNLFEIAIALSLVCFVLKKFIKLIFGLELKIYNL